MRAGRWWMFCACVAALRAQQIDTVILKSDAQETSVVFDHVTDEAERRSFEQLLKPGDPAARRSAATTFLARYPASWLTARVLEVRAKAAIDVDKFEEALADGRESLRYFPENVLLLAPLANVAAHLGRLPVARRYALNALECLDRFTRPESIGERDWPRVESGLRASMLTVLGRVELQADRAAKAIDYFEQALLARRDEEQAAYQLGRAYLAMGRRGEGAAWLAEVARAGGALSTRARGELTEADLKLPAPRLSGANRPAKAVHSGNGGGSYAGSHTCRPCHVAAFDAWKKTGMAKMFRPVQAGAVAGDFRNQEFSGPGGDVLLRMVERGGGPAFELRGPAGWTTYAVDYVIGSKWQQGYVTRGSDGGLHVLPIQYNLEMRRWINYWETIDPPHSLRADVRQFRAAGAATNYTRNCAPCHTSQLRAADGSASGLERSSFQEAGINCEMCHGPASGHARSPERVRPAVEFAKVTAPDYLAVCSQCHMQSAVRDLGRRGEMNYPAAGSPFPPQVVSRPYDQFLRRAFYKDGRFRETTFIAEALMRSRCYRDGGAHCGSCHHPHAPDAGENPVSLKFRDRPDERCLQCHEKYRAAPERHTRHAAQSAGSRCEACHMPRIMNALLFKAGTHTIDDIPRADTAARFGAADSPNACLLCHTDKDAKWLGSQLLDWRSQAPVAAMQLPRPSR